MSSLWEPCFVMFVLPTAVVVLLALIELFVYGGEG